MHREYTHTQIPGHKVRLDSTEQVINNLPVQSPGLCCIIYMMESVARTFAVLNLVFTEKNTF